MFELAQESLKQEPYTIKEIQDEFKVEDPFKIVIDISHYKQVMIQNESFPLFKRAYLDRLVFDILVVTSRLNRLAVQELLTFRQG